MFVSNTFMNVALEVMESLLRVYKFVLWNSARDRSECYYPEKLFNIYD